jgi:hypothetical protein
LQTVAKKLEVENHLLAAGLDLLTGRMNGWIGWLKGLLSAIQNINLSMKILKNNGKNFCLTKCLSFICEV